LEDIIREVYVIPVLQPEVNELKDAPES